MKSLLIGSLLLASLSSFAAGVEHNITSSVKKTVSVSFFDSKEEATREIEKLKASGDIRITWWAFTGEKVEEVKKNTVAELKAYINDELGRKVDDQSEPTCNTKGVIGTIDLTCEVRFY